MLEDKIFPLSDEPKNSAGDTLFYLSEDSVLFIQRLLLNFTEYKLVPMLSDRCEDTLDEECILKTIKSMSLKILSDLWMQELKTEGTLIFSPIVFMRFIADLGKYRYVEEAVMLLLKIIQWIVISIYQCIYDFQVSSRRKRLVTVPIIIEALHEDELLSDVLRGLALD